jgi:putative aldouronate transport system substrate-binding protein
MNKKEIIFLSAVPLLVILFFLVATPSGDKAKKSEIFYSPTGWEKVSDNSSRKIKIRCASTLKQGSVSWRQKMLDEKFNLETEYMYMSPEAIPQKLPLMLAGGDIPDFFTCGRASAIKYAQHGFIMEIPYEMLLKYAPHIVKLVNQYSPNAWPGMRYEGRNYGVPGIWPDGLRPRPGLWRKDWLEKVGITKTPETLDEYYIALKKFRDCDPDGNGKKDTYGMTGDMTSYYTSFTEIFGANGVMPYNWMEKDGKILWGGIQPEARQTLELLNKWYREELIHPDFLTDKWFAEASRKFYNGKVGYHNYMSSVEALNLLNPNSVASSMKTLQAGSEITPGHPPVGPTGFRGHRVWGAGGNGVIVIGRHLAKEPEKVIRLLKMWDAIASDEILAVENQIGRKGVHWDWANPQIGQGSGVKMLPPYDKKRVQEEQGFMDPTLLSGAGDPAIFEKYLPKSQIDFDNTHKKIEWGRADIFNWSDSVPRSDEFLQDLIHLQQKYYAEIIVGKRALGDFDEFVQKWHKQGGDILLAEAQKLYDSRKEVLNKLGVSDERTK